MTLKKKKIMKDDTSEDIATSNFEAADNSKNLNKVSSRIMQLERESIVEKDLRVI